MLDGVLASIDGLEILRTSVRFASWIIRTSNDLKDAAWHEVLYHTPLWFRFVSWTALALAVWDRVRRLAGRWLGARR